VIWSVALTAMIGLPIAIWGAVGKHQPMTMKTPPLEMAIGVVGLLLKRLPIIILAACIVSVGHYIAVGNKLTTSAWEETGTKVVLITLFLAVFFLLYLLVGKLKRDKVLLVILDTMQTFPSFVYLIPAIMLFGINDVSVIFSIMIYTFVPLMRYTIEGLRNVPPELTEAADMSGATAWQKLRHVQLPMALPTMAIGFNQAIMFAFFMVIIAAFIGTQDIGQELQRTLAGTELGKNFILGISVSLMALVFDHITMRWSQKRREALGLA
jgi:ABC-type proline/glycine betaine transport system permease subunit